MFYLAWVPLLVMFSTALYQSIVFYLLHFYPDKQYRSSDRNTKVRNTTIKKNIEVSYKYNYNETFDFNNTISGIRIIKFNN